MRNSLAVFTIVGSYIQGFTVHKNHGIMNSIPAILKIIPYDHICNTLAGFNRLAVNYYNVHHRGSPGKRLVVLVHILFKSQDRHTT